MRELNRRAMELPAQQLVDALETAIGRKKETIAQRDEQYGKDRAYIYSYGENIYLPGTFGFDMRQYYQDPELALDIDLRSRLFWLDNSHADDNYTMRFGTGSMYFDMTLFGIEIDYTKDGVPNMRPHPLAEKMDLSLLKPFDFETTGEMPQLIRQYEALNALAKERCDGRVEYGFPRFNRGPLDIYVQLRGYENFVADVYDEPEFVKETLDYIVEQRLAFNKAACAYQGKPFTKTRMTIADDWVNFPFITPDMFEEFVLPAYRKIVENEGEVARFHTCGVLEPIARQLVEEFPNMNNLELSGWNDPVKIDRMIPEDVKFRVNFINTFVLRGTREEHMEKLCHLRDIFGHRRLELWAQAIVRLHPTIDESISRMNDFIDLAREIVSA